MALLARKVGEGVALVLVLHARVSQLGCTFQKRVSSQGRNAHDNASSSNAPCVFRATGSAFPPVSQGAKAHPGHIRQCVCS